MVADDSLTPEGRKTAQARIVSFQSGVCGLRLPKDWPDDAVLTLDGKTQRVVNGLVEGTVPGKHELNITRYGFSTPPPLELDFRGLNPLPLPGFGWKVRGAKVFVKSVPSGAAVWWQGKDTGKTTPFTDRHPEALSGTSARIPESAAATMAAHTFIRSASFATARSSIFLVNLLVRS
jgi:hypothetical protein